MTWGAIPVVESNINDYVLASRDRDLGYRLPSACHDRIGQWDDIVCGCNAEQMHSDGVVPKVFL